MTQHPRLIATLEAMELKRPLDGGKVLLVDVWQTAEYASERIHGALLHPLSTFDAATLPPDGARRVVFHCGSGKRSLAAAEKRVAAGHPHAAHLGGGLPASKAAGLPVIMLTPPGGLAGERRWRGHGVDSLKAFPHIWPGGRADRRPAAFLWPSGPWTSRSRRTHCMARRRSP
jgi:rhodanese-related sulfurtransferase